MLKNLITGFLLLPAISFTQVFICSDGKVNFASNAPLELIKAESNKVSGVVNAETKEFAFSLMIESFQGFNSPLQREHFLENYMEAAKYPTGEFKGKITDAIDFNKDGVYTINAKGVFNIHGKSKEKTVKVKVTVKNKVADVESKFDIALTDHDIKIPKVVNKKVADNILVEVKASLRPKGTDQARK
jgi:polyisoprenoid-binding protein YceI